MSYPTIYDVTYSYTGFQAALGDGSFPGTQLDADMAGLSDSVANINAFIQVAFRSDGVLKVAALPGADLVSQYVDDAMAAAAAEATEIATAAATSASASATNAAISETQAASSASAAQTARTGAETARTAAEAARTAAEAAAESLDISDYYTTAQIQANYLRYIAPQSLTGEQKQGLWTALSVVAHLSTGAALPTTNIGPIWHDDYADVLTWRTIGSYTGYASRSVGNVGLTASATLPPGTLGTNGAAISRTTYAALFARIGTTYGAGNGTTTFNLPEDRGYFRRVLDHGRGIDSGRLLGAYQADGIVSHTHTLPLQLPAYATGKNHSDGVYTLSDSASGLQATNATGGTETRPKNMAYLGHIHF